MFRHSLRAAAAASLVVACCFAASAQTQATTTSPAPAPAASSRNLAPGFTTRSAGSRLVIIPADMELYSQSAGGVLEPRADWTDAAQKNFHTALMARAAVVGSDSIELKDQDLDELAQVNALHGAVAEAVFVHHMLQRPALPTKEGRLDWTLGDAIKPLREKTGADYAVFFWVRDSYASAERKAAMVAMALFGVVVPGGSQIGYSSLVDLHTGRIVWFNSLVRATGDLREPTPAAETVEALLRGFPGLQ